MARSAGIFTLTIWTVHLTHFHVLVAHLALANNSAIEYIPIGNVTATGVGNYKN